MRSPILLAVALCAPLAGCTVYTRPAPAPVVVETYEPVYYGRHVVYYDDVGTPYYYDGGTIVYVPRTYARYNVLIGNYHRHSTSYRSWSRSHPPRATHRHERREPPRPRHRH